MNHVTLRLNSHGNRQYQQMPCHLDAHVFPSFTFEWLNCNFADLLRMINVTYCSEYPYIWQPGYRWKRGIIARQIHHSLIAAVERHRGYSSGYTEMSIQTVRNHLHASGFWDIRSFGRLPFMPHNNRAYLHWYRERITVTIQWRSVMFNDEIMFNFLQVSVSSVCWLHGGSDNSQCWLSYDTQARPFKP